MVECIQKSCGESEYVVVISSVKDMRTSLLTCQLGCLCGSSLEE